MKILIQGAGIAGLALANALKQKGITPTIIEKDPKKIPSGYLIYTWDNGRRILRKLGLEKEYDKYSKAVNAFDIIDYKGQNLQTLDFLNLLPKYSLLDSVERPELIKILRTDIKDIPIQMNTTVSHIKQKTNSVEVTLNNGQKSEFDLVVGADGFYSQIRQKAFPEITSTPYGLHIWIYKISAKKYAFSKNIVQALGKGKYMALYPNGKGHYYAYFAMNAPVGKYNSKNIGVDDLKKGFINFCSPFGDVAQDISDKNIMYHTDLSKIETQKWVKGNVVLIGDSQHAMSQLLGQASSLAFEDAYILAEELSNNKSIKKALSIFEQRRQDRVLFVQELSNNLMMFMKFRSLPARVFRKHYLTKIVKPDFILNSIELRLAVDPLKQKNYNK